MISVVRGRIERRRESRRRARELEERHKQLMEKSDEAAEWFRQHMMPDDQVDLTYEREIEPKLSPINFAFDNRELNQAIDPWKTALEKWVSTEKPRFS